MISWLQGKVLHIDRNEVTIGVQGVGYRVFMGINHIRSLNLGVNSEIETSIYTSVSENAIQLLALPDFTRRKIFTTLLSVNGVGPKVALSIVDHVPAEEIFLAIQHKNPNSFLQVSGVGKKTAQRILLDLEEKLNPLDFPDLEALPVQEASSETSTVASSAVQLASLKNDVKLALSSLGFSEQDVALAIKQHWTPEISLDNLIKTCLINLDRHK
ncbi:MAG: Holliday junction DNA helicase RuvA [bacterium]|jgi:Holliday junction DNA helicase RuvA